MASYGLSRVFALGLIAVACAPCVVRAQDQPVVFVHGLNSGPDTWRDASERLRARIAIEPHRFQTSSRRTIGDQANELQAQYPATAMPPVTVGHSNGGLVSRQWSRQRGMHGIVTIGTPHTGAPLVRNSVGLGRYYLRGYALLRSAVFALTPTFDEWPNVDTTLIAALSAAERLTYSGLEALAGTALINQAAPVLSDMPPGSPFLTELNSDANLERERLIVPHRVGIVSFHPRSPIGGPLRLAGHARGEDAHDTIRAAIMLLDFGAAMIRVRADPFDPVAYGRALDRADALTRLARWASEFELAWCVAITSTTTPACETSDALVPASSQLYPGGLRVLLPTGPVHTRQTTDSDDTLFQVLAVDVQVPTRTGSS